ncbi:glutamate-5-semialdehyde dehydrogenase [Rhodomicrobium lacus]|uniref:glutamate-5-semialdehyde dehydrogenase n=1 Tax=Rhodomicrobium lacus TaxID=2498452 RepID=UPI0026E42B74|nr:glutamate-5-semialdehyde dehydrogenase [Rhodomicrobium lacus]WKW51169.1 glutamate-5-semialdehyde dehydrogenase [Rhodomicrobium lacus]
MTLAIADTKLDQRLLKTELLAIGRDARKAARALALAPTEQKNAGLLAAAAALRARCDDILQVNAADKEAARASGRPESFIDRLTLTPARVEAMAKGLEDVAALADPVGETITAWERPNGLRISRVRVPLGVIGMIYESRPNVTADAGALALKAGNAVILRGGSETIASNRAIHACLVEGLRAAGLPETAIQLIGTTDRAAVGLLLEGLDGAVDVIVPRGGRSLVERVQKEARVPVFAHLEGICHVYVDKAADPEKARAIVLNAKLRRTGVCGSAETLLVDEAAADRLLAPLIVALLDAGCEVRGDAAVRAVDARVVPATDQDWATEYLDAIISARVVSGVAGAIAHIERYGSHHTDSIVTEDTATAETFLREVDSAIVLHNASTQFADGGEFGMGAEIGIATGRFHARGPVGVEQLTTFKYVVRGDGQTRPA